MLSAVFITILINQTGSTVGFPGKSMSPAQGGGHERMVFDLLLQVHNVRGQAIRAEVEQNAVDRCQYRMLYSRAYDSARLRICWPRPKLHSL